MLKSNNSIHMNNFKSGNAYKNVTWVCLAIPSPISDFPQIILPTPRFAQCVTGWLCPICILHLCWEWHHPQTQSTWLEPWESASLLPSTRGQGRAREGLCPIFLITATILLQTYPISWNYKSIPAFLSPSWTQFITCRLDILINKTSLNYTQVIIFKLLARSSLPQGAALGLCSTFSSAHSFSSPLSQLLKAQQASR